MRSVRLLGSLLALNGPLWMLYVIPYLVARRLSPDLKIAFLDRRLKKLERKRAGRGMSSLETNKLIWESWKWDSTAGEEWTVSKAWKTSLVHEVMLPRLEDDSIVLEIGPGGGRWTQYLAERAGELHVVDLANGSIEHCQQRFAEFENIRYHVTDGSSLSFLDDESIDFSWSFDVFVHIAPIDVEAYLEEISRVLRPAAKAVIHHADGGGLAGGWRSSMTAELFAEWAEQRGLEVIRQFDSWGGGAHHVRQYGDSITVLEKSAAATVSS